MLSKKRILITGGLGFIGSHLVNHLGSHDITVLDDMTYAANPISSIKVACTFIKGNIVNINSLLRDEKYDLIIGTAAETHVDNSIENGDPFIQSNIIGAYEVLKKAYKDNTPLIHFGTDEEYSSILEGHAIETSPLKGSSPYAASKCAASHLIESYRITYGFDKTCIVRPCNNYGPRQHPEKLIPKAIKSLLEGNPVRLYGNGRQRRNWIYVTDTCNTIGVLAQKLMDGHPRYYDVLNIPGDHEISNTELILKIAELLGKPPIIEYVEDRKGHDFRYAIKSRFKESPYNSLHFGHPLPVANQVNLDTGLQRTIDHYREKFNG